MENIDDFNLGGALILARLSKTPEAILPPAKTLGERIVSWTREAGCGAALEAVRALIAQALG